MLKATYNKLIKSMYNWAMAISAKSNAVWALVIISFIESSFFPIPPDIFLIPLILAQRQRAFQLALYCTVASVLGGFLGYGIGFALAIVTTLYGKGVNPAIKTIQAPN